MRRPVCCVLLALASCTAPPPPAVEARHAAVCRVGPDGARPVADRGIGGTGLPPAPTQLDTSVQTADRGIGGTGIIGVITGFASLCVAGQEVALPDGVPVQIDGHRAGLDDLRAGQVAAATASGVANPLRARLVEIRHLVIGPVDAVAAGAMTVAGQPVDLSGATGSALAARPGQWVAVSGFRQPSGMIAATRLDPAPPGHVLVRGELARAYGAARIGSLPVRLPDGADLPGGWSVWVTGRLAAGVLAADTALLDVAGESPSAYFGPDISNYIVEAYVTAVPGGDLVDRDFVAGAGLGRPGTSGRRILAFERGADGSLRAARQDFAPDSAAPRDPDFLPAPRPGGSVPLGGPDDDARTHSRPGPSSPPHR